MVVVIGGKKGGGLRGGSCRLDGSPTLAVVVTQMNIQTMATGPIIDCAPGRGG